MKKTKLMGILNVTPDSFFDQGKFFQVENAVDRAMQMIQEGVDIIDIGGESTRPGSDAVNEKDELDRVIPTINSIRSKSDVAISIDTMKPRVAAEAIKAGATMINDVGGFRDQAMIDVAVEANVPICVMHMKGTPKTMQLDPHYEEGIVLHLIRWFDERMNSLIKAGIKEKNIILDPGIGFGKTVDDNLQIIHNLPKFKAIGYPLLLGASRKCFMSKILNQTTAQLLAPTVAINTLAVLSHVDIIRVHDVKEHRMVIDLLDKYLSIK